MRQAYHSAGYRAYDLTECKIHRLVDKETGKVRFVLCYPKKWEADEGLPRMQSANGKMTGRAYDVREWQEVELEIVEDGYPHNFREGDDDEAPVTSEVKLRRK